MLGQTISHYEITELMGEGGMGVVYKARDVRLDRPVAIKFLKSNRVSDETAKSRFIQEAKAASALDHPNICSIYQIDETPEGDLFIVMAYYDGQTLDRMLADRPVPVGEAIGMAAQIAAGLAKAHSKGIVHRDIKPANAILTEDGVVKILDFGLAKFSSAEKLTMTGTSLGSPSFMSPEQVMGKETDFRTDIWSLGVTLFSLITGQSPFRGDVIHAVVYSILNETPSRLADYCETIPEGLQEILDRCLSQDPDDRYPDTNELYADLRALLVRLREEGWSDITFVDPIHSAAAAVSRIEKGVRRRGLRVARIAAVSAVLVAAATGLFLVGQKLMGPRPGDALRVVVMPPEVTSPDSASIDFTAASAKIAVMRGLIQLDNIEVMETRSTDIPAAEIGKIYSADEIVTTKLADRGTEWSVTLQRLAAGTGSIEWMQEFSVPHDQPLLLANAVIAHLHGGYPDHADRKGSAALSVSIPDYDTFLRMNQRYNDGDVDIALLDSLDAIRDSSPGFVDAYLLEGGAALNLFKLSGSSDVLDRGMSAVEKSREVEPANVRALSLLFEMMLAQEDYAGAESMLDELQRRNPGSVGALIMQANLAERKGEPAQALLLLRRAAERRPMRSLLYRLADLEYRQGEIEASRQRLEAILVRFPDQVWPQSKLAQIELLYGDPERAEELYSGLIENSPNVSRMNSLGLALELQGKFTEAAVIFRETLEQAPDQPTIMLNLADCEKLSGEHAAADSIYTRVLGLIAGEASTDWEVLAIRAQCSAQLKRYREAVTDVQEVLRIAPENSEALYLASLVYTLAGDRHSALVNAQKSIDQGTQARWFSLPWFDTLLTEPEFQALLASDKTSI